MAESYNLFPLHCKWFCWHVLALRDPVLNPGPAGCWPQDQYSQKSLQTKWKVTHLRFSLHETGPACAVISHHQPAKTSQPSAARGSPKLSSGFMVHDLIYTNSSPQALDLRCSNSLHVGPLDSQALAMNFGFFCAVHPNQLQLPRG